MPVVVGAGVGSLAAGGGAHAYMDFEGNTSAYVGDGATITAGKKLEILAENDLAVTVGEGAAAGSKLGELVSVHVIPRPHGDVEKILPALK